MTTATKTRTWTQTEAGHDRQWSSPDGALVRMARTAKGWHCLVIENDPKYPIIDETFETRGDALLTARSWVSRLTRYRDE